MRIVMVTRFGGPEVLEVSRASDLVAGTGQVVVGVSLAPVLTLDTQLCGGWGQAWVGVKPPE